MSYLVLARKYRPQTFAEVVGQEHVTRTLGNAFASGRVHHAFLFCGPRGCGKTTLARIVGKALNCEARSPRSGAAAGGDTAEPCGVCAACSSIGSGSAVDYQEMDGASNRGIDAIRELTEAVRYQPAVLRKKVYVIDEVHMLTTEAFNALLKTLEEPPPHVTFVLATTEPHKLPNTILSRCQRYDFKLVAAPRLASHLTSIFTREQLAVEPGAISLIVRESGGSVRDALSLCDQLISYVGPASGALTERHVAEVLGVADRSLTRTLVRALAHGDAGAALAAVDSAIERGVDEIQLARAIVRYLRDLSVLQVASDRPGLIDATEEELAELAAEAGALERSRVTQMFERMLRCCDELGKTLQPRMILDCALIDVATIEPLVPLGDLLDRLAELEARLAGKPARSGGPGTGGKDSQRPALPAAASRAPASSRSQATASPAARGTGPIDPVAEAASPARGAAPASSDATGEPYRGAGGSAGVAGPARGSSEPTGESYRGGGGSVGVAAPARGPSEPTGESYRGGGGSVGVAPARPSASEPMEDSNRGGGAGGGAMRPSRSPDPGPSGRPDAAPAASAPNARSPNGRANAVTPATPVPMQPSGPVPQPASVASGSGPHGPGGVAGGLAVPSGPAEALRAWNDVLAELEALRKLSLLGPFQHARVLTWTAELLELGFPVDAHDMGDMARDNADELRAIVRTLGAAFKNLRVAIRMLDANESSAIPARSILETTQERTSAERNKREAEARAHPITKHVLQTFGAQIKEIKTDV